MGYLYRGWSCVIKHRVVSEEIIEPVQFFFFNYINTTLCLFSFLSSTSLRPQLISPVRPAGRVLFAVWGLWRFGTAFMVAKAALAHTTSTAD